MKVAYMALVAGVFLSMMSHVYAEESAGNDIVEFHIAAGTGDGPWNTFDNPIVVKVGQTLRFINDDSVPHLMHTNGSPCPHGARDILPGETGDCVISSPHNSGDEDLYDHEFGPDAQIYIQANP